MLIINTQVNQSIDIGDVIQLTVLGIDKLNNEVRLSAKSKGNILFKKNSGVVVNSNGFTISNGFTMITGNDINIIPHVKLYFVSIKKEGVEYVVLGFDAPRSIIIRGTWNDFDTVNTTDSKKLSRLHDASLVYYASINAKTPLEIELFNRFKKTVRYS